MKTRWLNSIIVGLLLAILVASLVASRLASKGLLEMVENLSVRESSERLLFTDMTKDLFVEHQERIDDEEAIQALFRQIMYERREPLKGKIFVNGRKIAE